MILKGYKAPPQSINSIRGTTQKLRKLLGCETGQLDMIQIMELTLPRIDSEFEMVVSDEEFLYERGFEAYYDPRGTSIVIRDDVYDSATLDGSNSLRHQFTFAHELGHYLLHRGLNPVMPRGGPTHKTYEDTEWQADTFAGEFLMPFDEVVNLIHTNPQRLDLINAVSNEFMVSWDAARVRVEKALKRINQ